MGVIKLLKYKLSKLLYKVYIKETQLTESEKMAIQVFLSILSKPDAELSYIPNTDKKFIKWNKYITIMENSNLTIVTKNQYYSITLPMRTIGKLTKKFNRKLDNIQNQIESQIDIDLNNRLNNLINDIKN